MNKKVKQKKTSQKMKIVILTNRKLDKYYIKNYYEIYMNSSY